MRDYNQLLFCKQRASTQSVEHFQRKCDLGMQFNEELKPL